MKRHQGTADHAQLECELMKVQTVGEAKPACDKREATGGLGMSCLAYIAA